MHREHISALGYHIQRQREERLLRRRKLARLIGFEDSKEGSVLIRSLEETGTIDGPPDLLERVATILQIDEATIRELQEQDRKLRQDWLRKVSKPMKAYLGFRWNSSEIPEHVCARGLTAIEHYARGCAAYYRMPFRLVLNHRIEFVLDEVGNVVEIKERGRWAN